MEKYELLQKIYKAAPTYHLAPPQMQISEGEAVFSINVLPDMLNTAGFLHGAFIFKLMDECSHMAAQTLVDDGLLVTSSFNMYFIKPVKSGEIKGIGKLLKANRQKYLVEAIVVNENNEEIARGMGEFMKANIELEEVLQKF